MSDEIERNVTNDEHVLEVLCEDLKRRKYSDGLISLGLGDPFRKSLLGMFILDYLGLDSKSTQTHAMYNELLDKYCSGIKVYDNSLREAAVKVFRELKEFQV